ncbi:MAG: hypothetical protein AB8B95_05415 [Pseudohongiellaceae bacterium]
MISSLIVFTSLAMSAAFAFFYFTNARFREKIESPKHQFMEQLAQHASMKESVDER